MHIKPVLTVNALLTFAFGVALIIQPFELNAMYGVREEVWGVTGLFGATLIGLSFILWSLRSLDAAAQFVVGRALAAMNALVAAVALAQQQALWNNAAGWLTAAVYLMLAVAYLSCLLFQARVSAQARRV